jgi:hypothetical protein
MGDFGQKLFNKRPMGGKTSTGIYLQQERERNLKMASYLCLLRLFNILITSYQS